MVKIAYFITLINRLWEYYYMITNNFLGFFIGSYNLWLSFKMHVFKQWICFL